MRETDTFCSKCGATRDISSQQQYRQYGYPEKKSNTLIFLGIMSLAWAVIALGFGLYYIFGVDALLAELSDMLYEYELELSDLGFDLYNFIIIYGAIIAASGALALVTAICCLMRRFYIIALIACLISSFLGLAFFFVGIIGFIVAFVIYKSKNEFISNNYTL